MTRRKLKKALRRLKNLPGGMDFLRYGANRLYGFGLKAAKSTKVAYPSSIMLEVTNHCNLKCITCPREYSFGHQMSKGYMDFNKLKRIIDEAHPYLDSIGLTGLGETFLYKEIEQTIDYINAKNKGIQIFVSTNAHLDGLAEKMTPFINKLDTIQISVDGLNDTYNQVRRRGDFAEFRKNLKDIVRLTQGTGTEVMLNMVVIKENFRQMADVLTFAHDEGVEYVNYTPMNLAGIPEIDSAFYSFYDSAEFISELEKAKETAAKYPEIEFTYPNFKASQKKTDCQYLWGHFYITWDGYLVPCCAKPFPKILNFGNVFEIGLLPALNSQGFRNFRQQWQTGQIPDFCENCMV